MPYAASGRLREVNIGSQTWARQVYNGVGELARNRVTADDPCSVEEILLSTDYPLYGPTGQVLHLVTENGAGVAVDYVWLDDLPLAQFETAFDAQGVEQGTPKVTYLHADHLGTPRIGTNQAQQITWRWEATEAFGQSLPTGTDVVRLRFPGQVDLQVGMISYNYFRSYDALLGRYLESDPIGLEGGSNTYGYVEQNPLLYADPLGLDRTICLFPNAAKGLGHIGIGPTPETTQGFFPVNNELDGPGAVFPDLQRVDRSDMQCTTVRATEDQDRLIDEFVAARTSNGGRYNVAFRNCSTFVAGALHAGGVFPLVVQSTPVPSLLFRYVQTITPR